jgi:hypothetical protein
MILRKCCRERVVHEALKEGLPVMVVVVTEETAWVGCFGFDIVESLMTVVVALPVLDWVAGSSSFAMAEIGPGMEGFQGVLLVLVVAEAVE